MIGEMVERIARVLAKIGEDSGLNPEWQVWVPDACMVIQAMRAPTKEMLQAGCGAHPLGGYHEQTTLVHIIRAEWEAMIEEAARDPDDA